MAAEVEMAARVYEVTLHVQSKSPKAEVLRQRERAERQQRTASLCWLALAGKNRFLPNSQTAQRHLVLVCEPVPQTLPGTRVHSASFRVLPTEAPA